MRVPREQNNAPACAQGSIALEAATVAGLCTAWDATDACCQPTRRGAGSGDGGFVLSVIESALAGNNNIDPARISLVGIASAGFLALRLACDAPATFSGILAYAAGAWSNFSTHCPPPPAMVAPVPILSVHGTKDTARASLRRAAPPPSPTPAAPVATQVVPYAGGTGAHGSPFPGQLETVADYVAHNGCNSNSATSGSFQIGTGLSAFTVQTLDYDAGCTQGASVWRWDVVGSNHFQGSTNASYDLFRRGVTTFLLPRSRPSS